MRRSQYCDSFRSASCLCEQYLLNYQYTTTLLPNGIQYAEKISELYIDKRKVLLIETGMKGEENMPRGDGTGPQGQGPMTGRGMGRCPEGNRPDRSNPIPSQTPSDIPRGRGNAAGIGRGGTGRGLGQGKPRGQGNR